MDEDGRFEPDRAFARRLRRKATEAEQILWNCLKGTRTGFKFTRQYQVGRYFVDFCCRQRRVAVEMDGDSHVMRPEEDEARDAFLRAEGYEVLRFRNEQIYDGIQRVLEAIVGACERRPQFRY